MPQNGAIVVKYRASRFLLMIPIRDVESTSGRKVISLANPLHQHRLPGTDTFVTYAYATYYTISATAVGTGTDGGL